MFSNPTLLVDGVVIADKITPTQSNTGEMVGEVHFQLADGDANLPLHVSGIRVWEGHAGSADRQRPRGLRRRQHARVSATQAGLAGVGQHDSGCV